VGIRRAETAGGDCRSDEDGKPVIAKAKDGQSGQFRVGDQVNTDTPIVELELGVERILIEPLASRTTQ